MPVGTAATVKAMHPNAVRALGYDIVLSNTYHLMLAPGAERIAALGGLHKFMNWPHPILTDSGGFQVMSLAKLRKLSEHGVTFQSHIDGSRHELTPERSMEVQRLLGSDIQMQLDECVRLPCSYGETERAMRLSLRWAERSKIAFGEQPGRAIFGIVQGGTEKDLRLFSAKALVEMDFHGYSIGGLAVGEPQAAMLDTLDVVVPHLPFDKPRYLMGVGTPEEIVEYASLGVDMMDCVLPTRAARHGLLFTSEGKVSIKQARYAQDQGPLDANCSCRVCQRYSRAYLRHLYASNEVLAQVLNTVHNLSFYLDTMRRVRHSIQLGEASRFLTDIWSRPKP